MSNILTHERLKELLHYDADTGVFTRLKSREKRYIGVIKPTVATNGYIVISLLGKLYAAHRIAWCLVYGDWPKSHLDHINRQRADNRLSNLREATNTENLQNMGLMSNNTSGYKGVSYQKHRRKWQCHISTGSKRVFLGLYTTAKEASLAYESAAKLHHGVFYYKSLEAA